MNQERFRLEVDPAAIDAALAQLMDKARKLVAQGRYTRVRLNYKGKQIGPDIPLTTLMAVEGIGLIVASPVYLLLANLGVKALIEVEFIHEAEERIKEGQSLYTAGEVEAAEAKYREALNMRPNDPSAHYHLGILLKVLGRREEALTHLEKAAENEGPDADKARETIEKMKKTTR